MNARSTIALLAALSCCCGKETMAPPGADAGATDAGKGALAAGVLDSIKGTVTLEHVGQPRAVKLATDFFPDDAVETGQDGSARLVFRGGRVVELGPDGRVEISTEGAGMKLTIARGLVLTRLQPESDRAQVSLTIATPFGMTRIGAAEAQVRVDQRGVDLEVRLGTLEFLTRSGETQQLIAGQRRQVTRELPVITMLVTSTVGRVDLKKRDTPRYASINPKKPPTLEVGDALRIADGRLTLAPAESPTRLSLTRGAEATLSAALRNEDLEVTGLDLAKGELQVLAPSAQRTRVEVGGGLGLVSDLRAQYSVRRGANGVVEIVTLVGDLTLLRAGASDVEVPGGTTATVGPDGIQVVAPEREAIALPSREGLKVYHLGEPRLALTWDGGDDEKRWRVVVATDANFTDLLADGVVHQPFLNLPMPARGALYWRVYQGEVELTHGSATFGREQSTDLSRVKNLVPDGPDTTTIVFQDKPPTVTLTWASQEGAARYQVRVYREGALGKVVAERTTAETSQVLPEATLTEGNYRWSVTSLDAKGNELQGGRLNKLAMQYDNAVTQLVLKTPKNGEAVGAQARVSGVAPVGARVLVNGKLAELDTQARFDTRTRPVAGRVIVRMVAGRSETWTIRRVRK
jgi:hypothetical protein